MKILLLLLSLTLPLGGCALFVAGVAGAFIETQHRDWCWQHYRNPRCHVSDWR